MSEPEQENGQTSGLPAVVGPEVVVPTPVDTFEGDLVTVMEGKIPAFTMDMAGGYPRGTHIRLQVEVRVKSVHIEEIAKGDLMRRHVFAVESVQSIVAFRPEEAVDTVGGSASAYRVPTDEEAAELGVKFGRSSDQWAS